VIKRLALQSSVFNSPIATNLVFPDQLKVPRPEEPFRTGAADRAAVVGTRPASASLQPPQRETCCCSDEHREAGDRLRAADNSAKVARFLNRWLDNSLRSCKIGFKPTATIEDPGNFLLSKREV